jgi:poly(A) polymerase
LWKAMINTDERVARDQPVTPAFMFAVLLWQAVRDRAGSLVEQGRTELQAMEIAGEAVIGAQVQRTAIPRRFSAVTRQIWESQPRFNRMRGKNALRILNHPRFRAAYDFLLLRVEEDAELEPVAQFWTQAQKDNPPQPMPERPSRRRRPRRRGRKKSARSRA